MTSLIVFELLVSLTVQVTFLVGVAACLSRGRRARSNADHCWAALYICILLVTAAAFFLPHFRVATWTELKPPLHAPVASTTFAFLARVCGSVWLIGTLAVLIAGVAGMIRATAIVRGATAAPDL